MNPADDSTPAADSDPPPQNSRGDDPVRDTDCEEPITTSQPPPAAVESYECGRCAIEIESGLYHYHCLGCSKFDLCLLCAAKGIYCANDDHSWVLRLIEGGIPVVGNSSVLTPQMARKSLQALTTETYPQKWPSATKIRFDRTHRFISKRDPREILLFTAGVSLQFHADNGPEVKGGCAFVYRRLLLSTEDNSIIRFGRVRFRLENNGPDGQSHDLTENRAELRAVIAALQYYNWAADFHHTWRSIIIVTKSVYVAHGATKNIRNWEPYRWRRYPLQNDPALVEDPDLWKLLLTETRRLQGEGVNVTFMRIPPEKPGIGRNGWVMADADESARRGTHDPEKEDFRTVKGYGYSMVTS